ncbi:MAG: hypothetical protein KZQ95_11100 [Candidatus Thiodiazotropha sp. (ex Epidulcina cf. delphinae)]|nr:hypothetical protein [Candidatus Thiodiazotropha sp. (ex Epidulcina cf. delphinae)]
MLATFLLAVIWHVVVFNDQYQAFGYFTGEPSFFLGFMAILIQGAVLSWLYPLTAFRGNTVVRGLKFSFVIGLFFWTSHVLAFVAKQDISNVMLFVVMESIYLFIQFAVYGLLIGLIFSKWTKQDAATGQYQ